MPERHPLRDPVLGELHWSNHEDEWTCVAAAPGRRIVFHLGGEDPGTPPAAALLEHARDLVRGFDALENEVTALLEATAARAPRDFAAEIRALRIERVQLWSKHPGDGMIWFTGPDEYRLWHCDYVGGHPRDLVYDD